MTDSDKEKLPLDGSSSAVEGSQVEETRRKLVAKLAAGAFAIPAVLASISAQAAPLS
jgi:hypothetical protein